MGFVLLPLSIRPILGKMNVCDTGSHFLASGHTNVAFFSLFSVEILQEADVLHFATRSNIYTHQIFDG